jgi:hypothetical protein
LALPLSRARFRGTIVLPLFRPPRTHYRGERGTERERACDDGLGAPDQPLLTWVEIFFQTIPCGATSVVTPTVAYLNIPAGQLKAGSGHYIHGYVRENVRDWRFNWRPLSADAEAFGAVEGYLGGGLASVLEGVFRRGPCVSARRRSRLPRLTGRFKTEGSGTPVSRYFLRSLCALCLFCVVLFSSTILPLFLASFTGRPWRKPPSSPGPGA